MYVSNITKMFVLYEVCVYYNVYILHDCNVGKCVLLGNINVDTLLKIPAMLVTKVYGYKHRE